MAPSKSTTPNRISGGLAKPKDCYGMPMFRFVPRGDDRYLWVDRFEERFMKIVTSFKPVYRALNKKTAKGETLLRLTFSQNLQASKSDYIQIFQQLTEK